MAFIQMFCLYYVDKMKRCIFLLVTFITTLQYNILHFLVNRVSEPLVRSKMAITLELKLCLSNFSRGTERQKEGYQGTPIT